jgi:DNA modification methylase
MTKKFQNILDGINIGDGSICVNHNTKVGRLSIGCKHKELINYCRKLLAPYNPQETSFTGQDRDDIKKGSGAWYTQTKFHPDIYEQYQRWSPNGVKDVPEDIELTPITVLLWYLGDGSLSNANSNNSRTCYFSTNSFSLHAIHNILTPKLNAIGIKVKRVCPDRRIYIASESIPALLKYMGGKSPVSCYSYKFNIEPWRDMHLLKDIALKLKTTPCKLRDQIKRGIIECSSSPGGGKTLFTDEQFEKLKRQVETGEVSVKKGERHNSRVVRQDFKNSKKFKKLPLEGDEFYRRVALEASESSFPYPLFSKSETISKWWSIEKAMYYDLESTIPWDKRGMSLADSFHNHIFHINYKGKISPYELFKDDAKLEEAIKTYHNAGGQLTYSGITSAVSRNSKSKRVNNFSPIVARNIYNHYCKNGDKVLDFSAGFGGRLIGCSTSKRDLAYTGIDPSTKTFKGLLKTQDFINEIKPEFKCKILHDCAENALTELRDSSFDFYLTSPSYFDLEHYSQEGSQSYLKYPIYKGWIDGFLKVVAKEMYRVIKNGGRVAINVGKVGKIDLPEDVVSVFQNAGFKLEEVRHISFPTYKFVNKDRKERLEPLFVFEK